jgi:hypothetical protein
MRPPPLRKAPAATKGSAGDDARHRRAGQGLGKAKESAPMSQGYVPKRERLAVLVLPTTSARIGADPLHQIDDRAPQIAVFDIRVGAQQAKRAGDSEQL